MGEIKVNVKNISKVYPANLSKKDKIFSILKFWSNEKHNEIYYALKNVSFQVEAGDSIGLVGLNGAGKSTLSNLLGEVTSPTVGNIEINGKSSLIAISAGLNNELTGEENIKMKCLMHGLSESTINERYEDIVAFSELGEFIKKPIKTYSSGMKSRLGFAIAVHTDPDVLIVDEALSVGDDTFSNKCIERMKAFQKEGKTIFFVSHSIGQIQKMCNKAIWLHYGEVKEFGPCIPVVGLYARFVRDYNKMDKKSQLEYKQKMMNNQLGKMDELNIEKEKVSFAHIGYLIFLTLMFVTGILGQLRIIPINHLFNAIKSVF